MKFEDVLDAKEKYRKKAKIGLLVIAGGTIVAIPLVILFSHDYVTVMYLGCFWMLFVCAALVVFILAAHKDSQAYKDAYKTYFVEKNLANTFTDLQYDQEAGLSREVLLATQMVNTGDSYISNDFATGKYKDVAFTQADVHIQVEHTDSDGNTHYTTIFKGRFMIFEFPKKFNFRLEVVEKGFRAARIPNKDSATGRKFEKISLESDDFNRAFKTYAEDGFEAFYLLGPDFINNILELNNEHKGRLMLGFLENRLLIGLSDGKDAFEAPGVFRKLDEVVETEKVAKEIHLITNFVDKLKLDHKLFK